MFSATFNYEVKGIAKKFMNEFFYVSKVADENAVNANIKHEVVYLEENEKIFYLHEKLQKIKGLVISKRHNPKIIKIIVISLLGYEKRS